MKQLTSLILLLICCIAANANEVTYSNGTWAEIKAKAKAEHKYIMVDCYTSWCGWCKVMDKKTMPDPGVISLVNDKFVAIRMDMEHGEGIKLAMKYHISGFPTFMYFNPNGEFVYLTMGYEEPEGFIKELNNALDAGKQFHTPGYSASIDIDFPEFYKLAFGEKRKFPETTEVTAFLDKQKDLFSEVSWGVLSKFGGGEKYDKYFFDHIEKYKKLYSNYSTENKVRAILRSKLEKAEKDNDKTELAEVLKMTGEYVTDDAPNTKIDFRIDYCENTNDWDGFFDALDDHISLNGYKNAEFINSCCWHAYGRCDDKKSLLRACGYMDKVITTSPTYAYMDTYAALLYKAGNLKDAETWANKAIETGKKSGETTSSTEELLKKIKG